MSFALQSHPGRTLVSGLVVILVLNILSGCPGLGYEDRRTGNLVITVGSGLESLSIVQPDLDMNIDDYQIILSGPGQTQTLTIGSDTVATTITNLEPGEWTVTANARNADEVIIAGDSTTVLVQAGKSSASNLVVVPFPGEGTLELSNSCRLPLRPHHAVRPRDRCGWDEMPWQRDRSFRRGLVDVFVFLVSTAPF